MNHMNHISVGEFVRPLVEVEAGREADYRWMPLDESTLQETVFAVGQHVQFRAEYTGQLICFANDAHSNYWNNYGDLQVCIYNPAQILSFNVILIP
jgi:hypothetical protein